MRFAVPADHPCLPGHFPGAPIVPGVVVLDHVLAAIESAAGIPGGLGALRLRQVKFVRALQPGEVARIELERCDSGDTATRWRFRVLRDDHLLASGDVVAA
ncbi:MAG: hypothetical protein ACREO8_07520 [Luteimonas sp.]